MTDIARSPYVTEISLSPPYSVNFRFRGVQYLYVIDCGGLHLEGGCPMHLTPLGTFCFPTDVKMRDIEIAAEQLGARVIPATAKVMT